MVAQSQPTQPTPRRRVYELDCLITRETQKILAIHASLTETSTQADVQPMFDAQHAINDAIAEKALIADAQAVQA